MTRTYRHTWLWLAAICLASGQLLTNHGETNAAGFATRQVAVGGVDAGDCTGSPCATIQYAITSSSAGDTIEIGAGTFTQSVAINRAVTLQGAGIDQTIIEGPMVGGNTIQIQANGVIIDGVTITRAGNNSTDWNSPSLKSAGLGVQGLTVSVELRNSRITGMRSAIDINNSTGNFIHNNILDNNHTGMILRNVTDNTTVVENTIVDNRTVGVLFLDASGGTNSPLQTALNSTFSNNHISGNWYGQIVDRQTGGSLPAPGLNPKNFSGNWLGTTTPVATTANSAEPGYAVLIPVVFGGTAVPPGGQPEVAGPASANLIFRPLVKTALDTDVETTPGRGTIGFQAAFDELILEDNIARVMEPNPPAAFWTLHRRTGAESGDFVVGPDTPPLGIGSFRLQTPGGGDKAYLFNYEHVGTRLASIDEMSYATYQGAASVAIQMPAINVAINPNGPNNGTFATLVFEPVYNTGQGPISPTTWQTWDAYDSGNGVWWSTRELYDTTTAALVACNPNGAIANAPQCAGKLFVPWATIVAALPNAFISGGVGINQGSGNPALDASVDGLTIGVPAYSITYDFDYRTAQTITFAALADKVFEDPDFVLGATASSGLAVNYGVTGDCSVAGDVLSITGAGSCTVTASQPGNFEYSAAADVTHTFNIAKRTVTLTLSNLTQLYDGTPKSVTLDIDPPGAPGVTLTYDGSPTAPSAVGSYAVVASLSDANYEAADALGTLVIVDNRTPQVITAPNISTKTFTSPDFNITAYATSQLEITFSASGPCTVTPGVNTGGKNWTTTVDVTGVGSCTITLLQAGDATWVPASASRIFTINKANQKITFAAIGPMSVADPDFQVTATTTSGLPITFSRSGPCSLYGATATTAMVDITGAGKCNITASAAGDANYNAASPVKRGFTISALLALKSFTFAPSDGPGGCLAPVATVTLNANAPSPTSVTLFSSNTGAATVPVDVIVPAGQKAATFPITTLNVATTQTSSIQASMGPGTFSKTITVRPVGILSVTLTPGSVTGGDPSSALVTLNCAAPAGGILITMTSAKPGRAAMAVATFTIPEGANTGTVGITTTAGALTTAKITASGNGTSKSATLTITP